MLMLILATLQIIHKNEQTQKRILCRLEGFDPAEAVYSCDNLTLLSHTLNHRIYSPSETDMSPDHNVQRHALILAKTQNNE